MTIILEHRKYRDACFYWPKHGLQCDRNNVAVNITWTVNHQPVICKSIHVASRVKRTLISHHFRHRVKEGNTSQRRRVPGSMYRKKMALVTSLTRHCYSGYPAQTCEEWTSVCLHSGCLSVYRWSSRCRPQGLCPVLVTVLSCSHHADWPVGLRDTSSPSDLYKSSFWVPDELFFSEDNILQIQRSSILRQNISYSVICSRSLAYFSQHRASVNLHCAAPGEGTPSLFSHKDRKNNSIRGFAHFKIWNLISPIDYLLISDCIMPMNHVDKLVVNRNCVEWLVASYKLTESGWINPCFIATLTTIHSKD